MHRCLKLASQGEGFCAPNPMVGCVIVYENRIIGEGYHHAFGQAHAEVNAINSVNQRELLCKSELYVNLEPCAHHGKTPPCVELILHHKIPRVIIGIRDPFKEVDGRGIAILKKNNVEVIENVLIDECRYLNRRFFTFHEKKRPFIFLKWAQSKDGFIGLSDKQIQVSSKSSLKLVHQWRSRESAILIATNTAFIDNPALTVRAWYGNNPLRIVIDNKLRLQKTLQLFDHSTPTLVFNSVLDVEEVNLTYIKSSNSANNLPEILHHLYSGNILSVMVEGGARLLNSFIALNLWDEAAVIVGDIRLHNGIHAPVINSDHMKKNHSGKDEILLFKNDNPAY